MVYGLISVAAGAVCIVQNFEAVEICPGFTVARHHVYIYIYVCVYVCIYVCVCMYVCVFVCMYITYFFRNTSVAMYLASYAATYVGINENCEGFRKSLD